jgi:hypothetical protein
LEDFGNISLDIIGAIDTDYRRYNSLNREWNFLEKAAAPALAVEPLTQVKERAGGRGGGGERRSGGAEEKRNVLLGS